MTDHEKKGLVGRLLTGMSSMTVLIFLLLLSLYLIPRLMIGFIAVLALICLCRFLPKFRRAT